MELNDLKNTWQNVATPHTDHAAIKAMLSESNHPVLKGIRKQVVIEVSFWEPFYCAIIPCLMVIPSLFG